MNSADFIGVCLTAPQLRYSQGNQTPIAEFVVAVPNPKKDEPPCQFPVVTYGKTAEVVNQHVKPGMELKLQGRVQIDKVEHEDGTKDSVASIQARYINSLQTIFDATTAMAKTEPAAAPQPTPVAPPAPAPVAAGSVAPPVGSSAANPADPNYDSIPF
jgi:single-stranded DNA-binding protein